MELMSGEQRFCGVVCWLEGDVRGSASMRVKLFGRSRFLDEAATAECYVHGKCF